MCGITAVIKINSALVQDDLDWADRALASMIHRGPDSMRSQKVDDCAILGAVRLRITDRHSERADMPLQDYSGGHCSIVMNGEIYNYRVLKSLLADYPFQTESDTEVVLAAYKKWGLDFAKHLEGAYAIILFDKIKREVIVASDSVGEKPLYLREDGDRLWLSSTIQSLMMESSFSKKIDSVSIAEFLIRGFVTAPFTYLSNVQKIQPGTLLVISLETGKVSRQRYPLPSKNVQDSPINLPLKDALYLAAEQVIPRDQDASVLLSSGIDSRTVLGLAKFLGRKINAISLAVESGDLSCGSCESVLAEDAAIQSGFEYHKVLLQPGDYLNYWEKFIGSLSEPVAAFEGPFLFALLKKAAELGKVVLSGTLSDELFDGYGNFLRMNANRGHSDFVTRYLKATCSGYGEVTSLFNDTNILDSVRDRIFGAIEAGKVLHRKDEALLDNQEQEGDVVRALDILGVGSSYELFLLDQMSMAVSIESRALFTHPQVINAALSLPLPRPSSGIQYPNKLCLRNAMSGLVANCGTPKRAFPIPVSFSKTLQKAGVLKTTLGKKSPLVDVLNLDRTAINHLLSRNDYDAQEFALRLGIIERFL
jgi:asparagine synthase (glutamine-hydrolysing)